MSQSTCASENATFIRDFNRKAAAMGVPLTGALELTARCNLRCVHCFIPRNSGAPAELDTHEIKAVLDDAAGAGCLTMLLTGGEPLLRPDFAEIYTHAKRLGLLVHVFTNGTLVTSDTVRLFRELPPQAVEVSLYGTSEGTYEALTGSGDAHERAMKGIRLLHEGGVRLKLKTMLMSLNRHEFHEIEALAHRLDVPFRLDAALFPRLDGGTEPLDYRLSPPDAAALELSSRKRAEAMADYFERTKDYSPAMDGLYTCGAGRTSFYLGASGDLRPCVLMENRSYRLNDMGFRKAWERICNDIKSIPATRNTSCTACDLKPLCGYCPAFNRLETGDEEAGPRFLCELGHKRIDFIENLTILEKV